MISSFRQYVIPIITLLLAACQPRVATSFWVIATPAYSDVEGYTVIQAEGKTRHCYPVKAWFSGPAEDTYHELHHHGVAVESELMAYRIYFDKKQTIDVYCKRKPQLELATSYWYPNDSLLKEGYGDDILRVKGTVGVGTVKYWNNGKLYHIEDVGERQQWIVSQTRRKATIAVSDIDWTVPDGKQDDPNTRTIVNLDAEYTMRAGHRDMRCDVTVSEPIEGLCTGVQTIPAKGPNQQSTITHYQLPNGILLMSFGTDWPVNDTVKFAKETVGLGVFIPKEFAGELVQDKSNSLCMLNLTGEAGLTAKRSGSEAVQQSKGRSHCHFYLTCVGVTKENHPVATNATEWTEYLRHWASKLK